MTPAEIIMLITAIFTALAAVAALVTCYLNYRSLKPNISIEKFDNQADYFYYFDNEMNYYCVALLFNFTNSSHVGGSISEISISYNSHTYEADEEKLNYEINTDYTFSTDVNTQVKFSELRKRCPIIVEPYSNVEGFIIFPGIHDVKDKIMKVTVSFRIIGKKFRVKIKNLNLERRELNANNNS